ncbi:hypothetical protein [Comamonas koreensis]|uniref:hypothetical protein n=1 Tax=Comamonas koreensis TaxID=160825 RepID=UPI0015FB51CA|nr:hypothetical protein [Comamonas koreensis]
MTAAMPQNIDALSLADWIDSDFDPDEMLERGYDAIAAELRRLSKVEAAFKEWIEKTDWVQRTAKPAELGVHRADVLASRIAAMDAEIRVTNDMNQQLRDQNTAVDAACAALEKAGIEAANRAAAAEQQVTALTQRLDMANRLNTDACNLLAQQAASERLAKAFPQAAEMFHPLYVQGFKAGYRRGGARGKRSVLRQVGKLVDEVIAAPPPPEQEPRTNEWHHNSRVESAAGIRDALSRMGVYLTITTILQLVDITRKAHEIGATND